MLARVRKLFSPPDLPGDDNTRRIARRLYAVSVLGLMIAVVYAVAWALLVRLYLYRLVFALPLLILFTTVIVLVRSQRIRAASHVMIGGTWIIVTLVAATAGGTRSPMWGFYTLIVLSAVVFSGWRVAVAYATLTLLTGIGMVYFADAGLVAEPFATPISAWITQVSITAFVALEGYIIVRDIQQALAKSRHELAEREKAEAALRESEERFRLISSVTSDYTFSSRFDAHGNLEHVLLVGAFETITGYTPEEYMESGGWRANLHPDDRAQDERDMAVLRSNQRVITELRVIRKDGEVRWVRVYAHPVWDAALNRLVAINGAVQDITARKMAEESLQRSEAFLRALLDATTDVAFLMSPDGEFLTLNKTLAESFHKSVGEMVGQNVYNILNPGVAASRRQKFDEVIASRQPVRWQDQSDATFWDNQAYPILSPTGDVEAFAVYGREITEQKRLEAELQRYTAHLEQMVEERTAQLRLAKEQVETILNNTRDAVALAHLNGDIETRNPAFVTMFGDQVASRIEHILWAISDADQSALVGDALIKVIYEHEHQRVEARIASGNGVDRDVDLAFIPVRAADSATPHSLLVSAHDITHLKEIERFKERFVADAVHDLATPISGLSTRLYLLKKMPENTSEHIEALENQVEHLRNLLTELRTLSQLDRGILALSLQPCNLNRIVARIVATYEPVAIEKGQSLALNLAPTLPESPVDSHQIERVFVNLISNAINYTASGKAIRIETQAADDGVMFRVTDEGIGIGADDLPHVFERFYRTAKARETHAGGTGLGLAIVKEIIELHSGRVTVESTVDQGSTFTIWLPVNPDQSAVSKG